ncbi:MAG: hypothetical protein OSA98_21980 [Rubripirellula sp.]|nr:hypothetical protein [Rubripirellula sp.]
MKIRAASLMIEAQIALLYPRLYWNFALTPYRNDAACMDQTKKAQKD